MKLNYGALRYLYLPEIRAWSVINDLGSSRRCFLPYVGLRMFGWPLLLLPGVTASRAVRGRWTNSG